MQCGQSYYESEFDAEILGIKQDLASLIIIVVHSFPSWLDWGRNQVYCACCSAQTVHKTSLNWTYADKGQLISKCTFGVFKSSKKPTKVFPRIFLP